MYETEFYKQINKLPEAKTKFDYFTVNLLILLLHRNMDKVHILVRMRDRFRPALAPNVFLGGAALTGKFEPVHSNIARGNRT